MGCSELSAPGACSRLALRSASAPGEEGRTLPVSVGHRGLHRAKVTDWASEEEGKDAKQIFLESFKLCFPSCLDYLYLFSKVCLNL